MRMCLLAYALILAAIPLHAQDTRDAGQLARAAAYGDKAAAYELGKRYAAGDGVPRDLDKAVYWFEQAGRKDDKSDRRSTSQQVQTSPPTKSQMSSAWDSITGTVAGWGHTAQQKAEDYQKATEQYFSEHPEMRATLQQGIMQAVQSYMNGGGSPGAVTPEQASQAGRTLQQYQQQPSH